MDIKMERSAAHHIGRRIPIRHHDGARNALQDSYAARFARRVRVKQRSCHIVVQPELRCYPGLSKACAIPVISKTLQLNPCAFS
jgi:hypothetical protein